jgi:signal transduction histidine kinase
MAPECGSVTSLTEILEVNWIILYFVYGLVFFITGLIVGLQWQRRSDLELARPLPWLAAFGIAHGLNEWGYIFIPLQALYLDDVVVRMMVIAHLLLLAFSFFALFQFGVELLVPQIPHRLRFLRALPAVVLILWAAAVALRGILAQDPLGVLVAVGDGWSRYLLCLPGAALASAGLLRQARQMRRRDLPRIARYLTGAGFAFAAYAVAGGLLVPPAPTLLASVVNYDLLDRTLQIPAPVFRSVCGLAMAFFVTRSLDVFQVETERRIAVMERVQALAAERERIGRELHDGIIQNLYAAGLRLEEARHLVVENPPQAQREVATVMDALNQAIQDIRRYIFDLRAAEQGRELETILDNLVHDLRVDTLLDVNLEVTGQRCCWLANDRIAHITQVAREALSNVVQHAHATQVNVNLTYAGDFTYLTISDNGRGLDDEALNGGNPRSQGIANMRARAHLLGGDLLLDTDTGPGLRLTLKIPCAGQSGNGRSGEVVEL